MLSFAILILVSGTCTFLIIQRLKQDIFNSMLPLSSNPTSFYPFYFFNEVFSSCEEKELDEILDLQEDVRSFQAAKASNRSKKPEGKIYSVSLSIRNLEKKYEDRLEHYLDDTQDLAERKLKIIQLKNKLELGRKTLEKEKEIFLSCNGEYVRSFIFNRQNRSTDIFLTGISIPILIEVLKWDIDGTSDLLTMLEGKPVVHFMAGVFWLVSMYRIIKYYKNKRSMTKDMGLASEYDRAESMLYAFECALKNIAHETTTWAD